MKIGCQTYTWEMLGDLWRGTPDDLLDAVATAGYDGIEITDRMIGPYEGRAAAFAAALRDRNLVLVAFACASPSGFSEPAAFASDLDRAAAAIDFVAAFPGAHLSLGSATAMSEGSRAAKVSAAARFYNAAAARGAAVGVPVAVHPSSHHDTLLYTRADYDALFAQLDPAVGWVPDTGHILRGKQDILSTLEAYRERVRYLHLKDVDREGRWRMLGTGQCQLVGVIDAIRTAPSFNGWLVAEEESDEAARDPAEAVALNRETLRRLGIGDVTTEP